MLHILSGLMLFNFAGEDWVWFDAKVPWNLGLAPRAILTKGPISKDCFRVQRPSMVSHETMEKTGEVTQTLRVFICNKGPVESSEGVTTEWRSEG